MNVDLRDLAVGDTVYFRCGGNAKVTSVRIESERNPICVVVKLDNFYYSEMFYFNGFKNDDRRESVFDIVKVKKENDL